MNPSAVEFLMNYDQELRSMTRPDKAVINNLTMLAADNLDDFHVCSGIIRTVERCVIEVLCRHKVPLHHAAARASHSHGIV